MDGTDMAAYFIVQNLLNAQPAYIPNGTIGQWYPTFTSGYFTKAPWAATSPSACARTFSPEFYRLRSCVAALSAGELPLQFTASRHAPERIFRACQSRFGVVRLRFRPARPQAKTDPGMIAPAKRICNG
jgi:hypothetical protein